MQAFLTEPSNEPICGPLIMANCVKYESLEKLFLALALVLLILCHRSSVQECMKREVP